MAIASIAVDFTANVGQFSAGLQQMRQQTKDFQDDISDKLNTVKDAFEAFLAVEAFKQFGEAVMGAIDNISAMSDAATKLGVSAESYEALSFAAKEVGTNIDTTKVAFTNINKEIQNGAEGNEKAIDAFNKLGLSISALQQMSPEEQFAAITEAFKKMPDGVDKTQAGIEIFKKSFTELRPLLDQGAEGLSDAATNAASLGQLLSNVDVKNVKEAHTAIDQLGEAVSGLFNIGAAVAAPFITGVVTPFLDWLKQSKILFDLVDTAIVVTVQILQGFGYALDVANAIWDSMNVAVDAIGLGVVSLAGMVVNVLNEDLKLVSGTLNLIIAGFNAIAHTNIPKIDINLDGAQEKLGQLTDSITSTMKADMATVTKDLTDGNGKAIGDLGKEMQAKLASVKDGAEAAGAEAGKKFMDGVKGSAGFNDPMSKGMNVDELLNSLGLPSGTQVEDQMKLIEAAQKAAAAEIKLAEKYDPTAEYNKELSELQRLNSEKLISDQTYTEEKAKLDNKLQQQELQLYEQQHTWAKGAIDDINGFATSMSNAIVSGQSLGAAMKKFFSDMLTQLAEQIVKWEILKAIQIACGFAGGGAVDFATALGTATNSGAGSTPLTSTPPGRATGGNVASNTPYMVGENGPELFTPNGSGYITPNNQLGGGSGGPSNTVNQNIHIDTGVSQTVRAEMQNMMPAIQQAAMSAMMGSVKRGGVVGRTIRGF